jgi:3-hydroxyacyl-CoA dehydrogenase
MAQKTAEKKLDFLKENWKEKPDLQTDSDFINEYVLQVLATVHTTTRLETAYDSTLIFEAISENKDLKVRIFKQIELSNKNNALYFTNTSSIPINELESDAKLYGRVLGFHFYNPPAIQKLIELIVTPNTMHDAKQFALDLAKNMKKIVIESNDFAGFIGNGHFMRDALFAIKKAVFLSKEMPLHQAVFCVNKVTHDFLIRPMVIFQLIDYVGIDVVQFILNVMQPYFENEDLHSDLLDTLMQENIKGGQFADGSQKAGFFTYEKGKIISVYCLLQKKYIPISEILDKSNALLGNLPESFARWKEINFSKQKQELLEKYFAELSTMNTFAARLAKEYNHNSRQIALNLVQTGVAKSEQDVNNVMLTGFYHAYNPINDFLKA